MSERIEHAASRTRGALYGLTAAALLGVSAPLAKLLLGSIPAVLLAGLLYLGAALGLFAVQPFTRRTAEAALERKDISKLVVVVVAGGVVAPTLMLFGLSRVSALTGSLLLNLEAPFTMLVALAVFGEHLGRDGLIASALIIGGAVVLRLEPGAFAGDTLGVLLLAAACVCWAIDNNVTQRLSLRDPFAIMRVKALGAGVSNTALGLIFMHGELAAPTQIGAALVLGSLSYGASVVLDAYALRHIGAAREAAYFATAPFMGAMISVLLLGEPLAGLDVIAMALMGLGVFFMLRERHGHVHVHDAIEHEHVHVHDGHHEHEHVFGDPEGEPHSHKHRHAALTHDHPHVSDIHHRHRH